MSQQINLINPAFRKVFDWLTAAPLAIATFLLLSVVAGVSTWATLRADRQEHEASAKTRTLKDTQERLAAMQKLVAESKPNTDLINELANTTLLLKNREEIMKVLEGGAIGSTTGFAEFLRGFARQTPKGLWLTGFTIGAAGSDMEIRGRMVNPSALPEYIRRLKTEPVFQGRSFASLNIQRPAAGKDLKSLEAALASAGTPGAAGASGGKEAAPNYVEFVLLPVSAQDAAAEAALAAALRPVKPPSAHVGDAESGVPQKQSFVDPVLTPLKENIGGAAMEEMKKDNAESKALAEATKKLQSLMSSEKKP